MIAKNEIWETGDLLQYCLDSTNDEIKRRLEVKCISLEVVLRLKQELKEKFELRFFSRPKMRQWEYLMSITIDEVFGVEGEG